MKIKTTYLVCIAFALIISFSLNAQSTFTVPQDAVLKSQADFDKYGAAIIKAATWLEMTDLDKETEKRKQINAFVLEWVSGCPTITIEINKQLAKIYGSNGQLLGVYLASYAKNFLEQKSNATTFSATKAGLISMMTVYKKGIAISRSKEMDKLILFTADNKLDDYIKSKF